MITDVIVTGFDALGWYYVIGKGAATALTTTWNYILYKKWLFKGNAALTDKA